MENENKSLNTVKEAICIRCSTGNCYFKDQIFKELQGWGVVILGFIFTSFIISDIYVADAVNISIDGTKVNLQVTLGRVSLL